MSAEKGESSVKKFFVSGGVAWLYEFLAGHPLEFIKIVKQTKKGTYYELVSVSQSTPMAAVVEHV